MDPDRRRQQRQYTAFALVAAVVVLLLALIQIQPGAGRTIGLLIGLPIIAVVLVLAFRWGRAIRRP